MVLGVALQAREVGVTNLVLSSPDQLAAHLSGNDGIAAPLTPGRFSVEAVAVGLGDVSVRNGRNSPMLVQATVPEGLLSVVLPLGPPGSLILDGHASRERMAVVYSGGAIPTGANHDEAEWAVVTLD